MSIARLKKLLILGDSDAKTEILQGLQGLGVMHLVPLTDKPASATHRYEKLKEALNYLKNTPHKRRLQIPEEVFKQSDVVNLTLQNKKARAKVIDEIDLIRSRTRDLAPWGNFNYPDLSELDGYRLWFYLVPLSKEPGLASVALPWKILGSDHKQKYLVVLAKEEPSDQQVPFVRVHVGSRNLVQLKKDLNHALVKLEDLNAERESLTRWQKSLSQSLDKTINQARLRRAADMSLDAQETFALSGWIPESALPALDKLRETCPFAYQLSDPQDSDEPPTLLQNGERFGGGETAVSFFQLPGYRSWDPSVMIFFSFSLFFAIILADAGYALFLAVLLGLYWKKLSRTATGRRIRNLSSAIIATSTVYGIMIGSYFGIVLPEDSLLSDLQILNLNDFKAMMPLSIGVGVLHLMAANAMAGWNNRTSVTALANLGWIIVIFSSYCLWLDYLHSDQPFSLYSPFALAGGAGLITVLICSSERKVRSPTDLGLKIGDGILALYQVTKAFGDVLSYMRLFALGLSSASLAHTFNQLAISASEAAPAGGFILFTLIVLFGHALNFILAIMGGVIHGLRLNLLEFYNWGIKGEGYPFEAFKRNEQNKAALNDPITDSGPS